MAESFKLQMVHRRVIGGEWLASVGRILTEDLGHTVNLKAQNAVYLPLARRKDILRYPPIDAPNTQAARSYVRGRLPFSFLQPISGIAVEGLKVVPTDKDRIIFANLTPSVNLYGEGEAMHAFLGAPQNAHSRFLFQLCLGYSSQRLPDDTIERVEHALPSEVDLEAGYIKVTPQDPRNR